MRVRRYWISSLVHWLARCFLSIAIAETGLAGLARSRLLIIASEIELCIQGPAEAEYIVTLVISNFALLLDGRMPVRSGGLGLDVVVWSFARRALILGFILTMRSRSSSLVVTMTNGTRTKCGSGRDPLWLG